MKLTEIAERINEHLKRLEADKEFNRPRRFDKEKQEWVDDPKGYGKLYHSSTYGGGAYVRVTYVSYQGISTLTKEEAMAYLAWLDAGNKGTHYDMERGR